MAELTTLARPYAKAAFEHAQAHQQLASWSAMLGLAAAVSQDDTMQRVLKASQTPVEVVLTSDSNTYVTLFRVAKLGVFDKTAVSLKPGRYIVAGTRMGFRDVRIEFTVTGEEFDQPIAVSCNEAI